MFGKVASDILGLSDVGSVIKPENYDKVDADDYVMHEDDEKIFFLIKSKSDEYCFTNKALIHLDGTSAASKKRTLRRYDYSTNNISNVTLETAGTVDLDVEIKFTIGSLTYSIDVHKKHIEEVKDLYKALLKIAEISHDNGVIFGYAKESLQLASTTLSSMRSAESNLTAQFKELNEAAFSWLVNAKKQYLIKDFGFVFERYINN
ncbi:PH domain-containing protein [Paenactinomyces guangxiensis]|uniref:PH domain-containing protein n=1 Tax=Paenactinomyces guangxiensis TaxID=1490290 RepID=A0A7W1WUN1_9BACL|nr:PH domain-containing protein [Paenactinomyces guangxiensis]MBA4496166.1 PH domain-containing protein [Paenactinomyces guangxiensis]MBH8593254.1 PH domain-containing protein [Paenactinomyces guangxiensis]